MHEQTVDILIIGGGINGCGVAADAAGRGLKVLLCEAEDLASATSSWSSKLIHGGLRYLEQYDFKLVREALKERRVLMNRLPHLIQPLRFVLPHEQHLRSKWLIRLGLFIYDHLGGRTGLPKSKKINLTGTSLKNKYKVGFAYSDCRVDDSRLVVSNAQLAKEKGATILTRTRCVAAKRLDDSWQIELENKDGSKQQVYAKAIVNAAGPWVKKILDDVLKQKSQANVNLVKGSHIVVPKLYDGNHAYILQNSDGRIVFAIPYIFDEIEHNQYTLIGTTDVEYQGDLRDMQISTQETLYLLDIINTYFNQQISEADILWSYAGVRPLYDDNSDNPSKVTREYHFELEDKNGKLPLLSIFGGKLTTFRTLAEHTLQRLQPYFANLAPAWTAQNIMPGGDIDTLVSFYNQLKHDYSFLDDAFAYRLAYSYGSHAYKILGNSRTLADLGEIFCANLTAAEVDYLQQAEWAQTSEDILWRRSKLGLVCNEKQQQKLADYLQKRKHKN